MYGKELYSGNYPTLMEQRIGLDVKAIVFIDLNSTNTYMLVSYVHLLRCR